ncbi:3-hydroxyisobutyryl-CoA hydrolase-like protein 5 [Andrographis paniculata]|uniref:3-hydroxyisobutyryl-CoA hydrolase-like protein 5 n=1 Tax=Andrographis paniculata TaxID=175694 RepID=UPI0021E8E88A|nr:3-hydroxyisobutyryl-CoA hydrolase-like protein 5 [Andrographis paniculata]
MAHAGVEEVDMVVLGEEHDHVRIATLNQPRRLNVISFDVVALMAKFMEKWEKDGNAELILIKGSGRAFSAGGDLKMFYQGKMSENPSVEVVYRMYWLCYHLHTYTKTQVALADGITMGGGGAFMAPAKFSIVTENTVFATPETSVGFHTDCSLSYKLSRLPGHLGEFLGLTGARLNGPELIAIGFATHFVPSQKMAELESQLIALNSGEENAVRSVIEEISTNVSIDSKSFLNKERIAIIDKCFSKDSMEEILASFEGEASKEGGEWMHTFLKPLKKASPTALKITLRSIREARKQTLGECLKKEFRITMNVLKTVISPDVYEGIRALTIDKDNSPKWEPATLESVDEEKVSLVLQPFDQNLELRIPTSDELRWDGKFEESPYAHKIVAAH